MRNSKGSIMKFVNLIVIGVLFFCSSCSKTEYEKKRDLENKIIGQTWRQLEREKNLVRSEEHTSELQSHSFISYAVFCLKKKKQSHISFIPTYH